MKFFFCLPGLLVWASLLQAQDKLFYVGPAIGVNHFLARSISFSSPTGLNGSTTNYKPSFLYGLEGNYANKRFLWNARFLTTQRVYEVSAPYIYNPSLLVRLGVKARYFSLPLTISYKLKTIQRFDIFAGVGLVPEWSGGRFDRISYDILGSGVAFSLDPQKPNKAFQMGGSLQVIGRHTVNRRLMLQLQPALHYFKKMDTPFAKTTNSSLSLSLSVSYVLNRPGGLLYF